MSGKVSVKEVLQNNGDEWLVSVANMEPSATEDDDGIIDEVGSRIMVLVVISSHQSAASKGDYVG